MTRIRILLVEDHALVRAGVRALLERQADMEVAGEADDGQAAIQKAQELHPDVVLMDIAMPGTNGLEATRSIKTASSHVGILILTMLEDDCYFFQSIQAGASGFIGKRALPTELLIAIRTVARGDVYLYPALSKKLVREYLDHIHPEREGVAFKGLSARELEVVRLISDGRTSPEIAAILGISSSTVERHRQNIMAKLGLHNRIELVKYALRKGLVENDHASPGGGHNKNAP